MTNNDELSLNAEQCANILENISGFEPDDIDGDAVDLRFDLDGTDTGCTVSIVEQCKHAADALRALLRERDANKKLIAELEARTVAHDVGVMNIGNPYCEDHLVAWTVTGRQLAAGIYYLDARRVGDIRLEVEEV